MKLSIVQLMSVVVALVVACFTAGAPKSAFAGGAAAPVTPDQVHVETPIYQPEFSEFEPTFGTYSYTVSWEGIPAASLSFSTEPDGLYFKTTATARTWSGVDLIYRMRYRAEGLISAIDYLPVKVSINQAENSRHKLTKVEFKGDGTVHSWRKTNREAPKELKFDPQNFMLEPFSAAFLARSQAWHVGDTKAFDVFNGKSRYKILLHADEKTKIEFDGQEREVWVIEPSVVNLVNPKQSSKLRRAWIYVTTDKRREILKLVSEVFVGSVTTSLDSFTPLPAVHNGLVVAHNRAETALN